MANKYPSLSPYVYCGNNPVKLVDPSGEEIWIIGVDGSNIHYSQGMNYSGKDESVLNKINSLNQMNSTKNGEKLLGKLTTSKNVYAIVDKSCDNIKEAYYCANDLSNGKAGGTIVTQGDNSLKTLSHELFHAFQDEKGQGRASIHNEVEAMLFETSVLADYAYNNSEGYPSSALLGDNDYYNSIVSGLLNDFSTAGMNNVIRDFKSQSRANIGGTYNNYPLRQRNQSNNLIQDFLKSDDYAAHSEIKLNKKYLNKIKIDYLMIWDIFKKYNEHSNIIISDDLVWYDIERYNDDEEGANTHFVIEGDPNYIEFISSD